jgi:hypothetical protein
MLAYVLVALVGILIVSFCAVVAKALRQWHGGWRWAVGVPVVVVIAVVLNIVSAISSDPTAHNLWPFELLAWFALANLFTGILYMAHGIASRARQA